MEIQSTYKDHDDSVLLVEMEISAEEMDNQFRGLVQKYSSSISIPGFRKGKVPLNIVESKFRDELSQSVLEEVVPKAIEQVIKTHSLETIGPAELGKDHPPLRYESGKPLGLKLILNKKPSCEIRSYEGMTIVKNKYTIDEEDIAQNQKKILDSLGKSVDVEGEPQNGDMIHIDLTFKNEELKELNLQNHIAVFENEGNNVYPEYLNPLYEIIRGIKKGEARELDFTFPGETKEEKLKGKTESLILQVNRVSRFQPAKLDQETLDRLQVKDEEELLQQIRKNIEEYVKEQTRKESYDKALEALKKNASFVIPRIAVDYFLQNSWNQLAEELKMRGQKQVPENPPEPWIEENRDHAQEKIKSDLLISKVREIEKIEVGEEELENRIKEMADASKMDLKEYRKQLIRSGGFTELKKQMGYAKTLDWILSKCAVSEEKEIPFKELQKQHAHHH